MIYLKSSTLIFICLLLSCQSKVKSSGKFENFTMDNVPYELLTSSVPDSMQIFSETSFDENSVYIFRGLFDFGPVACLQLKPLVDSVIYYQYDLSKMFFDNQQDKMTYAFKDTVSSIRIKKFKYALNSNVLISEVKSVIPYSRRKEVKRLEKVPAGFFDYRYFIFLPKENSFYEINQFCKNEKLIQMVGEVCSSISFKEKLFFELMIDKKKATEYFWQKYQEDSSFFKNGDDNYLIKGRDLHMVLPKTVYN